MTYTKDMFKKLNINFGDGEEDYMLFKLAAKNWIDKLEKKNRWDDEKSDDA